MIGFTLNNEQVILQKRAKEFADTRMKPYARELDNMPSPYFDWKIVEWFAKEGYTSLIIPREYGGGGADYVTMAIVYEELATACAGMFLVLIGQMLAIHALIVGGDAAQKEKYLSLLSSKDGKLGAFAATEAGAGSDMTGVSAVAYEDGDSYLISGSKQYITNAGLAEVNIVLASSDPSRRRAGLDLFIVPGDIPGISLGRVEDKMGLRAAQVGEIVMDRVRVPKENLLGGHNTGLLLSMQTLDLTRPALGVSATGIARAAFETALEYTRERIQFGQPIFKKQAISFALADMATTIDAARFLTWRACDLIDHNQEFTKEASMAKLFATESAERICSQALHLTGAKGFTHCMLIEKYLRDIQGMVVIEGTSETQRYFIAGEL